MTQRSFSKGYLLWVDDLFGLESSRLEGGDIDWWRNTFGETESRVYRLLGLHLAPCECLEEALNAIDFLSQPQHMDTFVVAVVDLRIPRERDGKPDVKYGLELALSLHERRIPFFFLSAKSSALEELKKHKLETIPYYQKQSGGQLMMPEALARAILNEFRNRITWIGLKETLAELDKRESILPGTGYEKDFSKLALRHFPFFGCFRDFVERWEHRPLKRRNLSLVLRCPQFHSNAFVAQCLLIIFNQSIKTGYHLSLKFTDIRDTDTLIPYMAKEPPHNRNDILAFRIRPEASLAPEAVGKLARSLPHDRTVVFIVPNDDSADPFLEVLPRHQAALYDDLPLIRSGDRVAREELIRRSCEFVFQQYRLQLEADERPLGRLYLEHPEIVINPVNWVALMESDQVAEDLSDPYEIIDVFDQAVNALDELAPEVKDQLTGNRPIQFANLLCVAEDRIKDDRLKLHHAVWRQRALDLWLSTSWHVPYGLADRIGQSQADHDAYQQEWEEHCLEVTVALCHQLEEAGELSPLRESLVRAKRFLEHPAVTSLIAGNGSAVETERLGFLRWPHLRYPMPAALSRRLKEAGRFLWVQSDYLDLAMVLPSGNSAYQIFDTIVEEYATRLRWMKRVAVALPEGWRQSIEYLAELIESRQVQERWASDRATVWDALLATLRNATPISALYHCLLAQKPLARGKDNVKEFLSTSRGYGKLLGKIRGHRGLALKSGLVLNQSESRAWQCATEKVQLYGLLAGRYRAAAGGTGQARLHELADLATHIVKCTSNGSDATDSRDSSTLGFQTALAEILTDPALALDEDWSKGIKTWKGIDGLPASSMRSLAMTKRDLLWLALDLLHNLRVSTLPFRYYDGYSLLAALGDLRNMNKDSPPQVKVDVIEEVLQILVWSIEGLVAQLKFCLQAAGLGEAETIELAAIELGKPKAYRTPPKKDLEQLLKVAHGDSSYEIFCLGIPGADSAAEYVYHCQGQIIHYHKTPGKNG